VRLTISLAAGGQPVGSNQQLRGDGLVDGLDHVAIEPGPIEARRLLGAPSMATVVHMG